MEDRERTKLNTIKSKTHPKEKSNLLSQLLFCWEVSIILKKFKNQHRDEDLYQPLKEHKSKELGDKLEQAWFNEEQSNKNPSFWKILVKTFGLEFAAYGSLLLLINLLVTVCQPLLLGKLIEYHNFKPNSSMTVNRAYLHASLMVVIPIIYALTYHSLCLRFSELGMKIQIACSSLIYRKCLTLRRQSIQYTSMGHVINLLSHDVNRFEAALLFLNYLWIAPIEVIVSILILDFTFGHAAVTGVAILFVCFPLQLYLLKNVSRHRTEIAAKSDNRVHLVNEIICAMQTIKIYTWEKTFVQLVQTIRKTEIKSVAAACLCRIIDMSFKMFVNRVTLFSCILVVTVTSAIVTPEYIFVVGTLFEMIRIPIAGHLSRAVTNLIELKFSLHRIEEFLLFGSKRQDKIALPTIRFLQEEKNSSEGVIARIEAENLTVQWNSSCSGYALYNLNLSIACGDLVAFVGAPGSGKSTLFQTILREIDPVEGKLKVEGSLAYVAQEPWIFSATIKQNILFGEEMNDEKYTRVLKACALDQDLSLFPFGDRTIVGERGVMLSGGQKSRVNLARAIYRDADIYLLDDPLAALDVNVAKQVFDECITKYLKHKTVVLITHQVQYLRTVKSIYYLQKGEIVAHGTYEELEKKEHFLKLKSTETNGTEIANVTEPVSVKQLAFPEEVKEDRSSRRIVHGYGNYCAAGGKWICLAAISLFLTVQLLASGLDYILIFCVNSQNKILNEKSVLAQNLRNQTHSKLVSDAKWTNLLTTYVLYVYAILIVLIVVINFLRSWIFVKFCTKAAIRLHDKMLSRIIFATMHFFNTNSSGRILNRFSKDVRSVDENLPTSLSETIQVFLNLVGSILLISVLNYWFIIPTIVFVVLIVLLSILFFPTNASNKRAEGITRSPIFSHLAISLRGLTTIKTCNVQPLLRAEFDSLQDAHTRAYYLLISITGTFAFWIDLFCIIFIAVIIFSFFFMESEIHVSKVGLTIMQAIKMTGQIPYLMRNWSDVETQMTSVERLVEYSKIIPEKNVATYIPSKFWPTAGNIKFESVSMKYSANGPLVLKEVSFEINSGEKIGIVGRTGAGKSSLISCLFRLFDFDGTIFIDGVKIKELDLNTLRSKITIISQEPISFSGTLRKNLDPLNEYHDCELWNALEEVELKTTILKLNGGLDTVIAENGSNFSLGQRQLFCLVRAFLRRNNIVILDEATASIDYKTDQLIQSLIKRKFEDCTVLTIAHRITTVMDSDRILVMDAGCLTKFDHASNVLKNSNEIF